MKVFEFEAYSPAQIAEKVESFGTAKARLPLLAMVILGYVRADLLTWARFITP